MKFPAHSWPSINKINSFNLIIYDLYIFGLSFVVVIFAFQRKLKREHLLILSVSWWCQLMVLSDPWCICACVWLCPHKSLWCSAIGLDQNLAQPMTNCSMHLIDPVFLLGRMGDRWRCRDFFIVHHQVPNVFCNMFPIAPHFVPYAGLSSWKSI
jgi:hypothetical protein